MIDIDSNLSCTLFTITLAFRSSSMSASLFFSLFDWIRFLLD